MAHFPQANASVRAPRVNLRRPISIDFRTDRTGIIRGNLFVVSSTGGRAQMGKPLEAGSLVELRIGTDTGVIRGIAETLAGYQTIHGWFQPFRFIALEDEDFITLKSVIDS